MATKTTSLDIQITGNSSGAVSAIKQADDQFAAFAARMKAQRQADQAAEQAKNVERIAIGSMADQFARVTQAASEAATAIRTGGTASQAFGKMVDQIPIVGQFKQAGEAIRELITGEKAAVIEATKLGESALRVSAAYREIAMAQQIRGTRGDERSRISIEQGIDAQQKALNARAAELEQKRLAIESNPEHFKVGGGLTGYNIEYDKEGHYTDAQKAEMEGYRKEALAILALRASLNKDEIAAQKMLKEESTQRQVEFIRAADEQVAAVEASMQEKALRRQGKGIESALVAVDQAAAAQKKALAAQLDPLKLAGLSDEDAAARKRAVFADIDAIDRQHRDTVADLQRADENKKAAVVREGEETIKKIQAEANIAHLESLGKTLEAEEAKIRESSRAKIAEIEKAYRAEHEGRLDFAQELKDARAAVGTETEAKLKEAEFKANKARQAEQLSAEKELSRFRMESLKNEIGLGDASAERQLKELENAEHYKEQRFAILELMNKESTSLTQKLQLSMLLSRSGEDERMARATILGGNDNRPVGFASLEEAGGRTSFGQPAMMTSIDTIAKNTDPKNVADVLKRAFIDALNAAFPSSGTTAGPIPGIDF